MPDDFRKLQNELYTKAMLLATLIGVSLRVDGWRPDVQTMIAETVSKVAFEVQSLARTIVEVCRNS